ncbi:MAG: hypothetical protein ACYC7E_12700 [Armatimonadota bacterium]
MAIILTIAVGTIASLVAAMVYQLCLHWRDAHFCKKHFGSLAGKYLIHDMDDKKQEGHIVIVKHRGGNILETECTFDKWQGAIWMSRDWPDIGSGVYRHNIEGRENDCGRHEIQVNRDTHAINVSWENTSHDASKSGSGDDTVAGQPGADENTSHNSRKSGRVLWKRVDEP